MAKIIWIDTETTGLSPKYCAITQLAGLIEIDGVVVDGFDFSIKPFQGALIEEAALKVQGKTLKEIEANPLTYPQVHSNLLSLLGEYVAKYERLDKFVMAGYNVRSFDQPFLRALFDHEGDKFFGSWFFWPALDVSSFVAEWLLTHRYTGHDFKLETICKQLEVDMSGVKLHTALDDVKLTRELYYALMRYLRHAK